MVSSLHLKSKRSDNFRYVCIHRLHQPLQAKFLINSQQFIIVFFIWSSVYCLITLQLLNSMVEKLRNFDDDPLPQDLQEGVDDDEWVCKTSC